MSRTNIVREFPEHPILTDLAPYLDELPPLIARKKVAYFTGGAISSKKMANDDSRGIGPAVRHRIGEAIVYPKAFFLAYLESLGVKTVVVPTL